MAGLQEMAKELGKARGRTDEYKALKASITAADDDRELVEIRNRLEKLEKEIEGAMRGGNEPDKEASSAYEEAVNRLQALDSYQRLVSAQMNFDKVVTRVNETIAEGIREGGESRIVLS
jgi:cell fate (sporulation/competence/biofilm development) regulator YlbF (YheA/YmcA/DUF963 family)